MVKLTDGPDMTIASYRGRKKNSTTTTTNLVRAIEGLGDYAISAVQMNGSTGERARTTVGVRQECLLSSTLFNIFLERIMFDALENHNGKLNIRGRTITKLRFGDDIDALIEE